MSRVTLVNPSSSSRASRMAVITTFAQKRLPSFRMRHPSSSTLPFCFASSS
jgi:hypothetical protein